jgi:bacterioferritin-associated ferredoxin
MCHPVTVAEVEDAVLDGAHSVEDIGDVTGAGTGCGCCHNRLLKIMRRVDEGVGSAATLVAVG